METGLAAQNAPRFAKRPLFKKILFSLLPLLFLIAFAEIALRLFQRKAVLLWRTCERSQIELWHTAYPARYDEHLGWSLQPGATRTAAELGVPVSIAPNGMRSNGQAAPAAAAAILAVGDSFTFGDEVGDNCTWPAQLERDRGKPVINGGVFGYGFDQIVLRAEDLTAREKYAVLIVGVIDDDIERCEMSCRTVWKPYFEIDGDGLILKKRSRSENGDRKIVAL